MTQEIIDYTVLKMKQAINGGCDRIAAWDINRSIMPYSINNRIGFTPNVSISTTLNQEREYAHELTRMIQGYDDQNPAQITKEIQKIINKPKHGVLYMS